MSCKPHFRDLRYRKKCQSKHIEMNAKEKDLLIVMYYGSCQLEFLHTLMMVLMRYGESDDAAAAISKRFLTNPWLFDHNNGRLWPLRICILQTWPWIIHLTALLPKLPQISTLTLMTNHLFFPPKTMETWIIFAFSIYGE